RGGHARRQLSRGDRAARAESARAARARDPLSRRPGFHRRSPSDRRWRLADAVACRADDRARADRRLHCGGGGGGPAAARDCSLTGDGAMRSLGVGCAVAVALAVGAAVGILHAQQDVELRILSPGNEAYLTGPTLLRARVTPPESISVLTFF